VPYDAVASLMRDGVPADRIAEYFPAVGADAASDALDFARYAAASALVPVFAVTRI
jgi:hypothetical protein